MNNCCSATKSYVYRLVDLLHNLRGALPHTNCKTTKIVPALTCNSFVFSCNLFSSSIKNQTIIVINITDTTIQYSTVSLLLHVYSSFKKYNNIRRGDYFNRSIRRLHCMLTFFFFLGSLLKFFFKNHHFLYAIAMNKAIGAIG